MKKEYLLIANIHLKQRMTVLAWFYFLINESWWAIATDNENISEATSKNLDYSCFIMLKSVLIWAVLKSWFLWTIIFTF